MNNIESNSNFDSFYIKLITIRKTNIKFKNINEK